MSQVDAIIGQLEDFADEIVTKITLDITANLIETTPVDIGWARANWVPNIGEAFEGDADFPATPQDVASAGAEQQAGVAEVTTRYSIDLGPIFISNNVPYITFLNEGSSAQAPAGFVQRAIAKALTQDILSL